MPHTKLQSRPFLAEQTPLGTIVGSDGADHSVTLAPLAVSEAGRLGEAFAAIDPWVSYPFPASALATYFSNGDDSAPLFAVVIGDETAGVVGLRLNWLRGPYIQFLGFLPAFQSRGLGTIILSWIDQQTRAGGHRNVFVAASDFNAAALRFYERHGFERVGALKGLVRENRDEVLLHKRL